MARIVINGGRRLEGRVRVDGAKNAVLPILAACLLSEGEIVLREIPRLADVVTICEVLRGLGVKVEFAGSYQRAGDDAQGFEGPGELRVYAGGPLDPTAPEQLVRRMRASFLAIGPLVARLGCARMALPGGCAIGTRPIDLHLRGLESLGARVEFEHGRITVSARRLRSAKLYLDFPSVGATENLMMAAAMAEGTTVIENAAEEPEVVDLANFLNAMGARVRGAGTKLVHIEGVARLRGTTYSVIPDRIEAGTFLVAAAIAGGDITVENAVAEHMKLVIAKLREAGCEVREEPAGVRAIGHGRPRPLDIKTLPYPGFPTDMQAQMTALLSIGEGTSLITETVFENRFMHTDELKRMGAAIKIEGRSALVRGVEKLSGAAVRATDLRAGAALILAGLAAEGRTEIRALHHIDRGYVDIEGKLQGLGADVRRVSD